MRGPCATRYPCFARWHVRPDAGHTASMTDLRFVLAGAAIGNGNRGVEALGRSIADAVDRDVAGGTLSILDDGWGVRRDTSGRYTDSTIEYVGVRRSRRWHRPESWAQVRAAQAVVPRANPVAKRFAEANAVLDISAGDSFTDLYGPERLRTVTEPKKAALRAKTPLVLLPQTYGPFAGSSARRLAERLVRSAVVAYARDPWSYERLLELAGPDHDPSRLRTGVDVAFALEPRRPTDRVIAQLEQLEDEVTAGVNISGLLQTQDALDRYGLPGNYLETMTELVRALIDEGATVVFVPHVHVPGGSGESDIAAIDRVRAALGPGERGRTAVLPPDLDAAEVKWCISRLEWFVGSRMHATIAALSTLTPALGYAYSDKTQGVFQTCGVGDQVLDARESTGTEAVRRILESFRVRGMTRAVLEAQVPSTIDASREQLRDIFALVAEHDPAHGSGARS